MSGYLYAVGIHYHSGRTEWLRRRKTSDDAERAASVFRNCPSVKEVQVGKVRGS